MNTDKIYAEQLANEYAPKDTTKVVALRKLDTKNWTRLSPCPICTSNLLIFIQS